MKILPKLVFVLLSTALSVGAVHSQDGGAELLDPEVAFAATASQVDDQTIRIVFDIAEGYYLYNDKFRFSSLTSGSTVGEPAIPPGKKKVDAFFGEVEIQRDQVKIRLPFARSEVAQKSIEIEAVSQGCADSGVCYPPLKQTLDVALAQTLANSSSGGTTLSQWLSPSGDTVGANDDELLAPDLAFPLAVLPVKNGEIIVEWGIADGYYLYRDKFQFVLENTSGVSLGSPVLPTGIMHNDAYFGETEIFRNTVQARLPLQNLGVATEAVLNVTYQGCADLGVCYPPIQRSIPLSLTAKNNATAGASSVQLTEQDRIAAALASGDALLTIFTFLGLGLLLAFTPCVFPMVPILSSIIIGQGENIGTRRAFGLSLVYVLAMALTYTAAGILLGLSGENIQVWFQNPAVLISFAVLFVLLSLSMFGFYELQVPTVLHSKLTQWSNSQRGGTVLGVIVMGFLSALIIGPCITAPLVGALIYIAATGDAVLGGAALFALSVGMGIPLLLIGTSAGTLLPKAGAWMDAVKAVFGVLLLALGIWMLERILPLTATMALSALLLIASAIYMGALEPLREAASGWAKLCKALGLALLLYGAMLAIGAATGGSGFIYPLQGVIGASTSNAEHRIEFQPIKGIAGLNQALAQARKNQQTVMLDFYADWCISCKEMEAFTFTDPEVQRQLKNTLLLQADVTSHDELDQALLKHIDIFGPPAILFYDKSGNEVPNSRVVGFVPADKFSAHLRTLFSS